MSEHHGMARGSFAGLLALGLWLIVSPPALGYSGTALAWSDLVSGGVLILLGARVVAGGGMWASWAAGLVGVWLLFAPLLFWAPNAAGYLNDTLIGALAIGAAILVPHGMTMPGPDVPAGWSYNPSSWAQRAPVVALALVGFFFARYMAAYQLGHIGSAWDPFFGAGTVRVLDSEVSRAFPVSDAGLGATVYMLEVLMALMGGPRRWRTMPWMVALFGILVVPLGVTSIVLVVLQPLAVGAWCTACLATAVAMLVMIPLTLDEVVAMLQFLAERRRAGAPLWRTFWLGGEAPHATDSTSRESQQRASAASVLGDMVRGVTVPWPLLGSIAIGLWLMFAPDVLGIRGTAADNDHLVGALVITVAAIATAEVTRAARLLNVLFGVWLVAAPWLLSGAAPADRWSDMAAGILLIGLSLPRGAVREHYAGWDRRIR